MDPAHYGLMIAALFALFYSLYALSSGLWHQASGLILYPFLVGRVFILVILRSLLFNILNLRYILQNKCPMC